MDTLALGAPLADAWLNGGLRGDGVHELYAAPDGEPGAAAGFALLLGARACGSARPLMWLRIASGKPHGRPYAPGLAELGLDPDAVLLVELPDFHGLLIAAGESVRHGAAGAVVIEIHGRVPQLDLTASRRLALAAERGGCMVLIVRTGAAPMPSAAHTRWEVASAPSAPLPANASGHPVFDLRLLRQRGGRDGLHVQLEWNREQAVFKAPLSGRPSAVPAGGTADRQRHRAA
ncbi:ImuA family protein [Pelagerythrobacter sp.]|uniref:ImuA family protein n=1 Tax=Pelagerythrobacter sp. TaxID=2800702 RepID=UPI0035B2C5AB